MILAHHAYYWNGLTWTDTGLVPTASEKPGIWGNGGSSAIVVGDDVYRWNGAAWSRLAFPKSDFFAVGHGTDPSRVVLLRDGEGFPQKPPAVVLWNGGATLFPIAPTTLNPPGAGNQYNFDRWRFAFTGDVPWVVSSQNGAFLQDQVWTLRDGCWVTPADGFGGRAIPSLRTITSSGTRVVAAQVYNYLDAIVEISPYWQQ